MKKLNDSKGAHFTPLTDDDLEQVSGGAGKGLAANLMQAIDNVGANVAEGYARAGAVGVLENGFGAVNSAATNFANGFYQGAHGDTSAYQGFGQNFIDGARDSMQETAEAAMNYGHLGGAGLVTAEAIGLAEFVPGVLPVTAGAVLVDGIGGGIVNSVTPEVAGTALGQLAAPVVHAGEALYAGASAVYEWATGPSTGGSPGDVYVPATMGENGEINPGYMSPGDGGFSFENPEMSDFSNSVVTTEGFDNNGDFGGGDFSGGDADMGGFSGTGFGGGESDIVGGNSDFGNAQMSDYGDSVVTTDMGGGFDGGGGGGGGGSYSEAGGSYAGGDIDNGGGGGAGFGNNGAGDPSSYSMDGGGSGGSYV